VTGPRIVDAGGTELAVHEWGPPDGRLLIFWPGLGSVGGEYLVELAPILVRERALRVVGIDPPGVGDSPEIEADGYRVDALAGLVPPLLDALGIDRCVFLGHSWGGWIGMAAAQAGRFDGLALIDAGYQELGAVPELAGLETLERCIDHARSELWRFDSIEQLDAELDRHYDSLSPEMRRVLHRAVRPLGGAFVDTMSPSMAGAALHWLKQQPAPPLQQSLARSAVPVLLLASDRTEALAAFGGRVPGAEIRVMPHWKHDPIAEHSAEVAETVGQWAATL
jgi:pimeloyl-ACP methyl ester carboxylesterase